MSTPPPLPKRASKSEEPPAVRSLPSGVDWRHAPTVRMQVPLDPAQARARSLGAKLLGSALVALAALSVWGVPHLSGGPRLPPKMGTAELLELPPPPNGFTAQASAPGSAPPVPEPSTAEVSVRAEPLAIASATRKLPEREVVRNALRAVAPAVAACVGSKGGSVRVRVTFAGATGQAVASKVVGRHQDASACIAREVRRIRVPAFEKRRFAAGHTFSL